MMAISRCAADLGAWWQAIPLTILSRRGIAGPAYANTAAGKAEASSGSIKISTLLKPLHYASFSPQERNADAQWARQILAKKPTMPGYLRRRERPWFRKANALLMRLPSN